MSSIPRPRQARPPTATSTYLPQAGWTRPPSTTLATALRVGGLYPIDVLAGVSAQMTVSALATVGAGGYLTAGVNVTFPDLPPLVCAVAEQPILLVFASAFATIAGLAVTGFDVVPSVLSANSTQPLFASYLPAGANLSSYAALITPLLFAPGATVSGGRVVIRASAQLYVRRLV